MTDLEDEEAKIKAKFNLDDHVRVAVSGSRPKRIGPPRSQGQANEIKGFGDVVARWTKAVGIKPCEGCRRRQQALNRALPFRK